MSKTFQLRYCTPTQSHSVKGQVEYLRAPSLRVFLGYIREDMLPLATIAIGYW